MQAQTIAGPSHFTGCIFYRRGIKGIEFLVIKYLFQGRIQIKFAGGVGEEGESPEASLVREIEEETGIPGITSPYLVFTLPCGDSHTKLFYACRYQEEWDEKLRTTPMQDGEETISAPYWIGSREAVNSLFRSHREAFFAAISKIAQQDREFCEVAIDDNYLTEHL